MTHTPAQELAGYRAVLAMADGIAAHAAGDDARAAFKFAVATLLGQYAGAKDDESRAAAMARIVEFDRVIQEIITGRGEG